MAVSLNENKIRALTWQGKEQRVTTGTTGLMLIVRQHSKTWVFRKRRGKKSTLKTIGHWPGMSLKEAKAIAAALALETYTETSTVAALAEQYLNDHVRNTHKIPRTAEGFYNRAIIPALGHKKVSDITTRDLAAVLQEYKPRGARATDTLRGHLKTLFSYAVECGLRADNPARELTSRLTGYKAIAVDRILTAMEIRALFTASSSNAKVIRFQLATGCRISECFNGYREGDRWIIPAEHSKNKKAHWFALTGVAIEQLPLPSVRPDAVMRWLRCSHQKGIVQRYTSHDARRSASTIMNSSGVAPHVVEKILNHSLPGIMAIYNQSEYADERVSAAGILERELQAIIAGS